MDYSESEVLQYIAENDVKFIKLFFTDIFGDIKSISIQPSELPRAFKTGISFDASAVRGFLSTSKSDLFIVPDPATLSVLPWRPQHGRVVRFFCTIRYPDGTPFEGDTRLILQKTEERAAKLGYGVQIGTECEFYLFQMDDTGGLMVHQPQPEGAGDTAKMYPVPHDHAGYCDLAPADRGENVRRDICLTLEQMGIAPEASHHETGPGQHEVDFKYSGLLNAADNLATFKTVVRTVAARNGLFASFAPKPFEYGDFNLSGRAGSGLHLNISLTKGSENLFDGEKISPTAQQFLAGVLSRIREITAFLNPLHNSYRRLGEFEAPRYVSWSRQNRSQLVRIPAASGENARMELRSPDPACNQYLALALVINAGLEGIEQKCKLQPADDRDLFRLAQTETEKLVTLPQSLEGALELAAKSDFVRSVLPEVTLNAFTGAKSAGGDPDFNGI